LAFGDCYRKILRIRIQKVTNEDLHEMISDVNKDLGPKAKAKDLEPKAKDLVSKPNAKAKDLVSEATDPHQA